MFPLIILAAGESRRMGSPKALLRIGTESFVQFIVRKAESAGVRPTIIVTGPDHQAIVSHVSAGVRCIQNESYAQGQISSLRKGIMELPGIPAVLVWPIDQPLVTVETVRALISAYEEARKALTIPVYHQRRGHPVIYNHIAMASALKLSATQTGKDLQSAFSEDTTLVDVTDAGVTIDIDTPEDYRKYVGG